MRGAQVAQDMRARGILLLLLLFVVGCGAAYNLYMGGPLRQMSQRNYTAALAKLEKPEGTTNLLLYRLERGLIFHYQGEYELSNQEFARAETLIDALFTRSVSREVASLLTNDAIRAYRGEEFERVLIHYYRAMNYHYLGEPEGALVECRKANLKLEDYARVTDYELGYKNDAFMQYLTGLLYEAEGEWNDAYVSYRDAEGGYQAYRELFGMPMPRPLGRDLARVAGRLGYEQEKQDYLRKYRIRETDMATAGQGRIVAFIETGFVARKHQYEVNLPILEGDDTGNVWMVSNRLAYRHRHPYAFRRTSVKYWLRVALPEYRVVPSPVHSVRISAAGKSSVSVVVEDLNAIAMATFQDKQTEILTRTAARALAKYLASKGVSEAFETGNERDDGDEWRVSVGKLLGALVNFFGVATEAADTRSWMTLPAQIHMARLQVPAGTVELQVEFLDASGGAVEANRIPAVSVEEQSSVFVNFRGYR